MKIAGFASIFLLTACILSYGVTGAFAAEGSQEVPLSVETNLPGYADGSEINISGKVRDSSLAKEVTPVILRIISADGSTIVGLAQLTLNSNNEYSHSMTAGGPLWKTSGEYTIKAQYGAQKGEAVFTFTAGGSATTEPEPVIEEPVIEEPVIEEPEPVMIAEPEPEPEPEPMCGAGTVLEDGKCVVEEKGGGCLIATAAYGSEMAPQVQFLREIRDGKIMATESGTAFMTGFNQFYYSFSPVIADYERENPVFKEAVKVTLTPLLTSLAILNYVDIDTEQEMLGYGIGVILLNIGMYFVAPAAVIIAIKNRRK
tara:strand:+ start:755 stop:1696 length:942 start_codon:yes stop_codon:yes gene_type:complete